MIDARHAFDVLLTNHISSKPSEKRVANIIGPMRQQEEAGDKASRKHRTGGAVHVSRC